MTLVINIVLRNLEPHLWDTNSDSVSFVKGALEANDVTVKVGLDEIDRDAINLFFHHFNTQPNFPVQLKAAGIKYGIVCTESISPQGVWNFGAEGEEAHTYTAFEIAANNAEFVWCQLPESVEVCRQINPNSAQLKYGYLDSMKNIRRLPSKEQDIDLLMAGMPSHRREKIMEALSEEGYRTNYPGQPLPVYIRDSLLARSRLSLSLQKTDKHQIVSVTRICHSVVNQVPLLLETSNPEKEYARFCLTTVGTDIVLDVKKYLTESDLETWSEQRYQELADELPMDRFMADLLS
jgi:hypothetical protein